MRQVPRISRERNATCATELQDSLLAHGNFRKFEEKRAQATQLYRYAWQLDTWARRSTLESIWRTLGKYFCNICDIIYAAREYPAAYLTFLCRARKTLLASFPNNRERERERKRSRARERERERGKTDIKLRLKAEVEIKCKMRASARKTGEGRGGKSRALSPTYRNSFVRSRSCVARFENIRRRECMYDDIETHAIRCRCHR